MPPESDPNELRKKVDEIKRAAAKAKADDDARRQAKLAGKTEEKVQAEPSAPSSSGLGSGSGSDSHATANQPPPPALGSGLGSDSHATANQPLGPSKQEALGAGNKLDEIKRAAAKAKADDEARRQAKLAARTEEKVQGEPPAPSSSALGSGSGSDSHATANQLPPPSNQEEPRHSGWRSVLANISGLAKRVKRSEEWKRISSMQSRVCYVIFIVLAAATAWSIMWALEPLQLSPPPPALPPAPPAPPQPPSSPPLPPSPPPSEPPPPPPTFTHQLEEFAHQPIFIRMILSFCLLLATLCSLYYACNPSHASALVLKAVRCSCLLPKAESARADEML